MKREMKGISSDLIPVWINNKLMDLYVKFGVSFLIVGLAFLFLVSYPIRFPSSVLQTMPSTPTPPAWSRLDSLRSQSQPALLPPSLLSNPLPKPVDDYGGDDIESDATVTILSNVTKISRNDRTQASGFGGNTDSDRWVAMEAKCDIFMGNWVPDQSGPIYTNSSCLEIEHHQNCIKNGRPDSGYLYWRWRPRDCELPRFDSRRFLGMMRDKYWAFIGDSISRNHVQSLLCILSQVEEAVEMYHDEEYRSKRWHFPLHNFTLSVIWSPFLLKAEIFEDINGVSSSDIQLHLDQLDETLMKQFSRGLDYAVISGGKWFLKTAIYHENGTILGCHYCPGKNLTELGFDYAYRKALGLIFNFIIKAGQQQKTVVFFRTSTPDHFEKGEWFSGGTCNRTIPFKDGEIEMKDVDKLMRNVELEEFNKAETRASDSGQSGVALKLKLLDTTRLSLLRPDGHPGLYRQFQPFAKDKNAQVQTDCLHWCLPGSIDSWNDLIMEMLERVRNN